MAAKLTQRERLERLVDLRLAAAEARTKRSGEPPSAAELNALRRLVNDAERAAERERADDELDRLNGLTRGDA